MVCRLCLNESFNLIEIFGEQGTKMEIPSILSTHFWFELKIDDPVSTSICSRCWHNTENFHVFYLNVKEAQNMLERSSAIGLSDEVIIKTECTEDDTPNVSLPGSSFFDQNNTRVNATTKSGFVQETVTGYTDKYMKNIPATSTSNFDSTLTEELILKSEHEEYDERGDSFDVDNRYDYLPQSEDDKMTVDPMLNDSKNAKRPQKKPNTSSYCVKISKKAKYDKLTLQKCIEAVKNGMSLAVASRKFGIPKTTLRDRITGKYSTDAKVGSPTILNAEEENLLVQWAADLESLNYLITKREFMESVELLVKHLNKSKSFAQGKPGRRWYHGFLKRHPKMLLLTSTGISVGTNIISKSATRIWLNKITEYLRSPDYLPIHNDPKRLFICDESNILQGSESLDCEGTSKKLFDCKAYFTILLNTSAGGTLAPPLITGTKEEKLQELMTSFPEHWGFCQSKTERINPEVFYEYITKTFYPWVMRMEIELPIILYVNGKISHLSCSLSEFCRNHKILVVPIIQKAIHTLLVETSFSQSINKQWKLAVKKWKEENPSLSMNFRDYGAILQQSLKSSINQESTRNTFEICGLYPFNPEKFDYSRFLVQEEI